MSFKSVSQLFVNVTTSTSTESTSTDTVQETESRNRDSGDINVAVTSSTNELTVNKITKETDNLKRLLVEEEFKQKKCKEGRSRSFEGN